MDIEVLKSYLVKLGFSVDKSSLGDFEKGLKKTEKSAHEHADSIAKKFGDLRKAMKLGEGVEGATGALSKFAVVATAVAEIAKKLVEWQLKIVGAFTAVSGAVVGMIDKVAMADQKYRLLGLRMFMTGEQARRMQTSIDALGISLEDSIWDPELRGQTLRLEEDRDANARAMGADFEDNMKRFRELRFEWIRLKENVGDLIRMFANSVLRMLGTDLETALAKLHGFNAWFMEKMPAMADFLAKIFAPILKQTSVMFKELGNLAKEAAVLFTNFVAIITGDEALAGPSFSIEKFALALTQALKVLTWLVHGLALFVHFMTWVETKLVGVASAIERAGMSIRKYFPSFGGGGSDSNAATATATPVATGASSSGGDIASRARELAIGVGANLGVDPKLVFEQWQHETNGFTNRGATTLNNLGGIKNPGGIGYRSFSSLDDYASYYTKMMNRNFSGVRGAKTEEDWVTGLQRGRLGGYFEDSREHYLNGMKAWGARDQSFAGAGGGGNVHIGNISLSIMQPAMTSDEVRAHVVQGVKEATRQQKQQTQRNLAQLAFAG